MSNPTITASEALEIERVRAAAAAEAQQRKIAFYTMVFTTIMGTLVTPLMFYVLHGRTVEKIDSAKQEVKQAAQDTAMLTAKSAAVLDEKVDANLKQWKAYNTKEPEDMHEAARALTKAERPTLKPPVVAAKEVP